MTNTPSIVNNQSATANSVSVPTPENWNYTDVVSKSAERQVKGITREGQMLNRNKLISSVCATWKGCYSQLCDEKTGRIPTEYFTLVENAVDKFITSQLNRINVRNVISYNRTFHHNVKKKVITEREKLTAENVLGLQTQLEGVKAFIRVYNDQLTDYRSQNMTPLWLERIENKQKQLAECETTKAHILELIAAQAKLESELPKA